MKVTALALGEDLIARLDSAVIADGRSRSNAARLFLEAALNADAALRRQAENHFTNIQMPGCLDLQGAAGVPRSFAFSSEEHRAGGRLVNAQPSYGAAVDELAAMADFPAAPSNSLPKEHKMTVPDPHAQLKADAVRTADKGIPSLLQPKKDPAK